MKPISLSLPTTLQVSSFLCPIPHPSYNSDSVIVGGMCEIKENMLLKMGRGGFPSGAVVESLPANAGDTGSSPGLGRSHMPRSN